jgi:peptidoglycan/xylan/chitin deacetylase (PgdA/CDA1 family)
VREFAEQLRPDALAMFLLHGVVPEPVPGVRNYTGKHLDAARFRGLCEALLAAGGTPVTADGLVRALSGEQELPARAFLLSFDDGFRNNLTVAAPIMRELGITGVFYVTTRFVDEDGASWIDLIEDAIARTAEEALSLPWEDRSRRLDGDAGRIELLDEVRRVVKTRDDLDPEAVAEQVMERAGTGPFQPHPQLDAKLTWDEVRELDAIAGFVVGGHTHTHRILSHLDGDQLAAELDRSLELLSPALGRPVRHYSYPEGLEHCYSDAVIAALRERGIVCCPTAEPGVNRVGDDLFRLRRIEAR